MFPSDLRIIFVLTLEKQSDIWYNLSETSDLCLHVCVGTRLCPTGTASDAENTTNK